MEIIFKKAAPADLPLLQRIGRESYTPYFSHIWHVGGVEFYMEHCFGDSKLAAYLADPQVEYFLPTTAEGEIIGLLKLIHRQSVPEASISDALQVEKIYVLPQFFKKGVGQQLLQHIVEMARETAQTAVFLHVMKTGAVKAYEKAGFRIVGEVRFEFDLLKAEERGGWVMVREV